MCSAVNITLTLGRRVSWQFGKSWQNGQERAKIMARYWDSVKRTTADACWPWIGPRERYGIFTAHGQRFKAHVFTWLVCRGDIPAGQKVCHNCDNTFCVNPSHLRLDTQAGNLHESVRKGRKRAWGLQKLDAARVSELRQSYAAGQVTQAALADRFGIARNTVSQIVTGKTWAHLHSAGDGAVKRPA